MITGIAIENFKGIRERVSLELRPITLLFGANSAGKSTFLHPLHDAREIFERHNLNADETISGGSDIDLGGFEGFVLPRKVPKVLANRSANARKLRKPNKNNRLRQTQAVIKNGGGGNRTPVLLFLDQSLYVRSPLIESHGRGTANKTIPRQPATMSYISRSRR